MAIFNYAAREMTAKIVYYGPGLSGKTTSIQHIHSKISPKNKGKLVSLATETDRTLFFDFFPVEFGQIGGFKVKFNFYTVPGQVFYNTTRKLVLKGADGVVFVADSQAGMMDQNLESLENLKENLKAHGIDWETVPFAMQYNKRDLPGVMSVDEMRRQLNPMGVPDQETSATTGEGIMETMKAICKLVLEDIQKKQKRTTAKGVHLQPQAPKAPEEAAVASAAAQAGPKVREISQALGANARAAERETEVDEAPGVQRTIVVPVKGPGEKEVSVNLPLQLKIEEGVQAVQVAVHVRVNYLTQGVGDVHVKELSAQSDRGAASAGATIEMSETVPEEPEKKRGFFGRLFGGSE